jgi:hypothetical protein
MHPGVGSFHLGPGRSALQGMPYVLDSEYGIHLISEAREPDIGLSELVREERDYGPSSLEVLTAKQCTNCL